MFGKLYKWYREYHRDLPFRRSGDFYSVWISEVMLQQTRVAAMLDKYRNFMRCFPDIKRLAQADLQDVYVAWQGLGYYTRARNIHKGAQYLLDNHKGVFPSDYNEALKIPGVGPYTAAAVLSISYDLPVPVIDGNVKRVIARVAYPGVGSDMEKLAAQWMDLSGHREPSLHNQAIMELGAMVCIPSAPECSSCPIVNHCKAYKAGGRELAKTLPPKKKTEYIDTQMNIYWIANQNRKKFLLIRDPEAPFFPGQWFFPSQIEKAGKQVYITAGLDEVFAGEYEMIQFDKIIRHSITRHRIRIKINEIRPHQKTSNLSRLFSGSETMYAGEDELENYCISSIAGKIKKVRNSSIGK